MYISGDWADYIGHGGKCRKLFPKKVEDKLLKLRESRSKSILYVNIAGVNKLLLDDLTRQVISTLDASPIRELKASTKKFKRSTSMQKKATKSLSETGAVGGGNLEIDEHLITSKRNETFMEMKEIRHRSYTIGYKEHVHRTRVC
ncbi:hypothetical protein NPIL_232951 [Nephila pilipes]|uniref:Uncharacterized protein n=1 Tax=Nephila pilipes TaxID=299642 RepID=A0A8X6NJR5_NEPPI|nr:hypothetical protein NPIL_232951 [Nephila pilipes]